MNTSKVLADLVKYLRGKKNETRQYRERGTDQEQNHR